MDHENEVGARDTCEDILIFTLGEKGGGLNAAVMMGKAGSRWGSWVPGS